MYCKFVLLVLASLSNQKENHLTYPINRILSLSLGSIDLIFQPMGSYTFVYSPRLVTISNP